MKIATCGGDTILGLIWFVAVTKRLDIKHPLALSEKLAPQDGLSHPAPAAPYRLLPEHIYARLRLRSLIMYQWMFDADNGGLVSKLMVEIKTAV